MSPSTVPFTYGIKTAADRERVRQQNGEFPKPHVFRPSNGNPEMCWLCFATRQANAPWHLED